MLYSNAQFYKSIFKKAAQQSVYKTSEGMWVMTKLSNQFAMLMVIGTALSACTMNADKEIAVSEVETVETTQETVVEATPELPSLFFTWDISGSNIISPPIEVRTAAIAACQERNFDTADMVNLAISGSVAEAEFGCRGAD